MKLAIAAFSASPPASSGMASMYGCRISESGLTLCASTTNSSGALTPGPKPSAIRSADLRWVVSRLEVVSDGSAISRFSTGILRALRPSTTTAMTRPGAFSTKRTQRRPREFSSRSLPGRLPGPGLPASPGILPANAFEPHRPSSAGTSVSATSTEIATVAAAASPIQVRNSMPASASATNAVNTVVPAKTTEEPAVPTAMPAASSGGRSRASWR